MTDKKRLTLGFDFDGTIVTEKFPKIGEIKPRTVELMRAAKEAGHLVIVWTARSGKYELDAQLFLIKNNIPYDYINCNPEDPFAVRGEQGRKLFFDYLLDDRVINIDNIEDLFNKI